MTKSASATYLTGLPELPDRQRCAGAIVGKALEPLAAGTSRIQALVTLQ